ncbi:DNA translocase FtsK [Sediminibacillus massiliensis]|uniref:DNA translocase FtsK n=1 Tax=Sediminibacillus massiliensis TaxID=1926277 RepID=UPI000988668E|nr:DNA translocase FtsK [Sediminibacillus massiliensis]
MWEQLKKRIKQLLADEEPESEINDQPSRTQELRERGNNRVETRISYQYPKERPFKFPMIPDKPTSSREPRQKQQQQTDYQAKEVPKREQPSREPNFYKESEQAQEPKRFMPTEVPSPIYGFRERKKHEEEIPAYLRKEEKPESEAQEEMERVEQLNQPSQNEHIYMPEPEPVEEYKEESDRAVTYEEEVTEHSEPDQIQDGPQELETSQLADFERAKKEKERKREDNKQGNDPDQGRVDEIKTEQQPGNSPAEPVEKQQGEERRERSRRRAPFNVIMTPRDKRNQLKKSGQVVERKPKRPPLHLLDDPIIKSNEDNEWVQRQMQLLETTLTHFNVNAKVVDAMRGPTVTRFEVQPELGVKVSKIKNLSDDIKMNMAARDIRMEAPIPGKNAIGIEVPNPESQAVGLQQIFSANEFKQVDSPLNVALGLDIAGNPVVTNLQKMPHGLIAGATGSGKSVCINTILVSLLYKASHEEVRFLLIDPKMVELAPYNGLPHLVSPVITDVKAATSALKWAVGEMEERYEKFVKEGVRDVERYNQKMKQQNRTDDHLPYLVIVIDELADLMMVSPQDVEDSICRIAQKARACGIHLLLATQRPSVDVITGLIKANIPTRIAFSVSSQVDSRTIIDTNGAEKLLGKGDMLFVENGAGQSKRIQGAFVSDEEIERVTNYVKRIAPPQYLFEQEQLLEETHIEEEEDELYQEAVEFVINQNGASASLLQRRFKIGYNRAARLIDFMEAKGIISEQKGSKPRDVLISGSQSQEYLYENNTK